MHWNRYFQNLKSPPSCSGQIANMWDAALIALRGFKSSPYGHVDGRRMAGTERLYLCLGGEALLCNHLAPSHLHDVHGDGPSGRIWAWSSTLNTITLAPIGMPRRRHDLDGHRGQAGRGCRASSAPFCRR